MKKDVEFVAGDYLYDEIPAEKHYLRKYFTTELQETFLVYYLKFYEKSVANGESFLTFYKTFSAQCGCKCGEYSLERLRNRCRFIEKELDKAMKGIDLERVGHIKSGNLKVSWTV